MDTDRAMYFIFVDFMCQDNWERSWCLFVDVEHVQSTAQLINALKKEAESTSDAESRSKLLSAAQLLADATTQMVDVAKVDISVYQYTSNQYQFICSAQVS